MKEYIMVYNPLLEYVYSIFGSKKESGGERVKKTKKNTQGGNSTKRVSRTEAEVLENLVTLFDTLGHFSQGQGRKEGGEAIKDGRGR